MKDDSLVMGYVSGEDAYAYPINVLNMHEIVNDCLLYTSDAADE